MSLRVLLVGGGGREHALAVKLAASPRVGSLAVAPGNAGIEACARCVDLAADDLEGIARFARAERIDLVVVGPERPLCLGLVDRLEREGIRAFGPSGRAAQIEGSKVYAKELMRRYRIPTAAFRSFSDARAAKAYLEGNKIWPVVLKASGLAGGKGAVVCETPEEARETASRFMEERVHGEAGESVVVEEFLAGEEVSVLALTDGQTILPFEPAQDHKRLLDGDRGPNTGGMGAVSPIPSLSSRTLHQIESDVLVPAIHALNREGRRYRGVLYAGLMLTERGPRVLEFNCRLGDPEAQVLLPRLEDDFAELCLRTVEGDLESHGGLRWDPRAAICVVAAARGYPAKVEAGASIRGLDAVAAGEDLKVFHAGTARRGGEIVTAGGRVLGVTALGATISSARSRAYAALEKISFEGMQFRSDIGERALRVAGVP
jgi:phosphoribosylamine--glycine ligase